MGSLSPPGMIPDQALPQGVFDNLDSASPPAAAVADMLFLCAKIRLSASILISNHFLLTWDRVNVFLSLNETLGF